jgi:ApaG protein
MPLDWKDTMEYTTHTAQHPLCQSDVTTMGFRVTVQSALMPERTAPRADQFFFTYHIRIINGGAHTATLEWRNWTITDALGHEQTVSGPGVVGKQPRLKPGQHFEYTSFCPLTTPFGTMEGRYRMVADDGSSFDIEVGPFALLYLPLLN